jgi:hypothetical protein
MYVLYSGLLIFLQLVRTSWWFAAAVVVSVALLIAAARSSRVWFQAFVAMLLFAASGLYSIWVLQLGWFLAALGILMLIGGAIWRARATPSRNAHPASALLWVGGGLLAAPFANIFVLMPILRPYFA